MIVRTRDKFESLLTVLRDLPEATVDTETQGLRPWAGDRLCGIGFHFLKDSTVYLPFRHKEFDDGMTLLSLLADDGYNCPLEWMPELWEAMRTIGKLVGHNVKFDLAFLAQDGYEVPEGQLIEETLCGARIYFPGKQPDMSLEGCTREMLGIDDAAWKQEFKDYLKRRKIQKSYDKAEVDVIAPYCEADCRNTTAVRDHVREYAESTGQADVYETEQEVLNILWRMEAEGIRIDKAFIKTVLPETMAARDAIQATLLEMVGREFNPWSNPELTEVFEGLGQKPVGYTEKGKPRADGTLPPSWSDENLQKVKLPIARVILNWRAVDKMLNTYFLPYYENVGDMVHATFKSWGPVTGRFSCENPNLQQLARRVEWDIPEAPGFDVQVRDMFIAPEGYALVCADYKQMEMVVWADYLDDPKLTSQINAGGVDYHDMVTKLVWKIEAGAPSFKKIRQRAKAISLGLVFGMGKEKLAIQIGESVEVADGYRKEYFGAFPTAKRFINRVYRTIEERGYVFNRFGRRYYLDADFAYKGVNYLIQGTSADIVKRAMVSVDDGFREAASKSRLAAQVHDEFLAYIWLGTFKRDVRILQEGMERQYLKTNLRVDLSLAAPNWGNKVPLCGLCYEIKEEDHKCRSAT